MDTTVQNDMLRLGELLSRINATEWSAEAVQQLELVQCDAEQSVRSLPDIGKVLGIGFAADDDRIGQELRLRTVCYLGFQQLAAGHGGDTSIAQTARHCVYGSSTKGTVSDAILRARHVIGQLMAEGILDLHDDDVLKNYNGRLTLAFQVLLYLSGGKESLALMNSRRIAALQQRNVRQPDAEPQAAAEAGEILIPSAKDIARGMRRDVFGLEMEPMIRFLSARLHLHLLRRKLVQTTRESGLGCVVTMVLGASPGIGKTHIARCALASAAAATPGGLAYSVQDCTHLTGSGWVGLDVSTAVASLVAAANGDVARAEDGGILCLDEICKKFTADPAHDGFRTVAVQQELLTLIEGADFQVGGRRGGFDRPYTISARALGFIFCGVLPELGRQMEKRLAGTVRMGFASQTGDKTSAESALRDVLLSAGMIEELLNRVNGILILPNPTPDTLRRIVTAPRGLIWQANQVLAGHGKIQLSEAAVDLVTRFGAAHGFSRAMASIMWRLTEDAAWNWNGGRKTIFYYEEGSIRKVINAMSRGSVGGRIRPVRKGDKDLDIPAPEPEAEPDAEPHGMSAAP